MGENIRKEENAFVNQRRYNRHLYFQLWIVECNELSIKERLGISL